MSGRSIAEIEQAVTDSSARLRHTIDVLERKAAPQHLMQQGLNMVRNGTDGKLGGIGERIASNPVPVALIGVGIGWLIWSALPSRDARTHRRLSEIAETEAAPTAPEAAKAPSRDTFGRHPLALGGAVALAGALLAMFLPRTRQEDAILGQTREALRQEGAEAGRDAWYRMEEIARDAASAAIGAAFETVREELGAEERQGASS